MKKWLLILLALFLLAGCSEKTEEVDPSTFASKELPDLWCDYFYLIDRETGQVLYDVRADEQMYPASMTKVMTSIIALESIEDPEDVKITFTKEMMEGLVEANANRAGFVVGDEATALDYIYGDLLPSGADCSRALAFYIAGDEENFVELMNEKALELGMSNTHYVNTSGLHDDDHYTTCIDMMNLYLYCLQNPTFEEIVETQSYVSTPVKGYPNGLGMTNFVLAYVNQDEPIFSYNFDCEGFLGGKSGYTTEAEYTLVSHADINGMKLALVNGHGYNEPHYPCSIEDATILYNWYREHYEKKTLVEENETFGEIRIKGSVNAFTQVYAAETYTGIVPNDENCHVVVNLPEVIREDVKADEVVGTVDIYDYDQLIESVPLIVKETKKISLLGWFEAVVYDCTFGHPWIVSLLLIGIFFAISVHGFARKAYR